MDITVAILQMKTIPQTFKHFDPTNFEILLVDEKLSLPIINGGGFVPEPSSNNNSIIINNKNDNLSDSSRNSRNFSVAQEELEEKVITNNNNNNCKIVTHLPRTRITFDQEPSEIAANLATKLLNVFGKGFAQRFRRAVPVALWKSEPSSPSHSSHDYSMAGFSAALFCAPIIPKEKHSGTKLATTNNAGQYRYHSFDQICQSCKNSSGSIDVETRHLLLRLEEWIQEKHKNSPTFLHRLFLRPLAGSRIVSCAHNPSHKDEIRSCNRVTLMRVKADIHESSSSTSSTPLTTSSVGDLSELEEEARYANEALTRMIMLEKCDCFVMNPFFGSGLPYKIGLGQQLLHYVAKGRPEPLITKSNQIVNTSDSSDSGSWMEDYPLHKAAYSGSADQIKEYLKRGFDPNQLDKDSWAPIHYATWYGNLAALQALLNFSGCSVNVKNKNGSTPLHFAAWCGHNYVVELLLSHPDISVSERDKDGKIPYDLCECVPKPEWQAVAKLLKAAEKQKLPKIQIELMDGSNLMISLINDADTTVAELQQQICIELKLNESCGKLFSLWLCSESLQIQLKDKHRPVNQIQRWKLKTLPEFSESGEPADEEPKLYFRRDVLVGLMEEKRAKLNDTALALLFHEARHNFLNGLYPCDGHDVIFFAATMLQILNGDYDSKKDKAYLSNEKSLAKLLPQHKLKDKSIKWVHEIMVEHKLVTCKGSKSITGLENQFLTMCHNLRLYGSAFFVAVLFVSKPHKGAIKVHVGVNDFGLHLINFDTKVLYQSFPYKLLEWFYQADKPYIEFKARDSAISSFTLRTRQAYLIQTLLSRWSEQSNILKNVTAVVKR